MVTSSVYLESICAAIAQLTVSRIFGWNLRVKWRFDVASEHTKKCTLCDNYCGLILFALAVVAWEYWGELKISMSISPEVSILNSEGLQKICGSVSGAKDRRQKRLNRQGYLEPMSTESAPFPIFLKHFQNIPHESSSEE